MHEHTPLQRNSIIYQHWTKRTKRRREGGRRKHNELHDGMHALLDKPHQYVMRKRVKGDYQPFELPAVRCNEHIQDLHIQGRPSHAFPFVHIVSSRERKASAWKAWSKWEEKNVSIFPGRTKAKVSALHVRVRSNVHVASIPSTYPRVLRSASEKRTSRSCRMRWLK